MDRDRRDGGSQLPARSRSAITVRSDGAIAEEWEGEQETLPPAVRHILAPYSLFLAAHLRI